MTAIGFPPTTSFTISCLLSNGTEYARASPSISTPSTSSSGPYSSPASSAETNEGLEIDGMASGGKSVTISYSRSGVGTGVGGGVLVAIGFAVFLCGLGIAVAVSGRGVCSTLLFCGAAVAVGAVAGVFGSGLADTVSARGVDVSGNGVSGAVVAVGAAAGVFVSGLADTVSDRGVDISGNGVPLCGRRSARSNGRRRCLSRPGSLARLAGHTGLSRLSASQRQDDDHNGCHY